MLALGMGPARGKSRRAARRPPGARPVRVVPPAAAARDRPGPLSGSSPPTRSPTSSRACCARCCPSTSSVRAPRCRRCSPPRAARSPPTCCCPTPDRDRPRPARGRPDRRSAARAARRRRGRAHGHCRPGRLAPPLVRGARRAGRRRPGHRPRRVRQPLHALPRRDRPEARAGRRRRVRGRRRARPPLLRAARALEPSLADAAFGFARTGCARATGGRGPRARRCPRSSSHVAAQLAAVDATLVGRDAGSPTTTSCARRPLLDRLTWTRATQHMRIALLTAAVERVGAGAGEPLLGSPWQERELRLALEGSLRTLARLTSDPAERITLVDRANTAHPRTWGDRALPPSPARSAGPRAWHGQVLRGVRRRPPESGAARPPRVRAAGTRLPRTTTAGAPPRAPPTGSVPARRHGPRRDRRGGGAASATAATCTPATRTRWRSAGPSRSRRARARCRGRLRRRSSTRRPNSPHGRPPTPRSPSSCAGRASAARSPRPPPRPPRSRRGTPDAPSCTLVAGLAARRPAHRGLGR